MLNGNGWKPKGMHRHTFERLSAEHDALLEVLLAGLSRRGGRRERVQGIAHGGRHGEAPVRLEEADREEPGLRERCDGLDGAR
jgi:hypothetical protein